MNIPARLRQLLSEAPDEHASGYSFLKLNLAHHVRSIYIYGNPIDTLIVGAILNDWSFETIKQAYHNIRLDFPTIKYVQHRYTSKHALEDYLTLCHGVLHALDVYEWQFSPLNRPDSRNLDWLREYFNSKLSEISEEEKATAWT